jgi:ABC-2 type transport system ATP-binding protein
MIQADRLTKRYGPTVAVDDVSFTVQPGRVTGFLGPNGAGKSTTMRLILGLDSPTSGKAWVNGHPYCELAAPLHEVGALLDAKSADGGRSAANHLLWLADSNGIARGRVGEVLDTVGLTDVAGRRVGTFSLGMSQRLGIAAALLGDPETLIFDEPINGLDPDGILWIRNLMRSLAADGRTVFVSSHLMSEMAVTAEHLIVIGRGRIIADASMDEILGRNKGAAGARVWVRVEVGRAPELARLVGRVGGRVIDRVHDAGEDAGEDAFEVAGLDSTAVGRLALDNSIALIELTPQGVSLEEAFLELTHDETEYSSAPSEFAGAGRSQT